MKKITVLNTITFLAAFLLFQIELIVSKILLPNFGGSYLVWGSCVVFFQAVLFLGYFFSYVILSKTKIKKYSLLYFCLSFLPLLCFPGKAFPEIGAVNLSVPLVLNVFLQLIWTIGPVFFVLSTTSVILQSWLADSDLKEKSNPYTLYALSNLGSFAALISYPFLFEVLFDLNQQLLLWRIMYFLLLGLIVYAVFAIKTKREDNIVKNLSLVGISKQDCVRWFLFSAAGVVMFLSVTNILTYEIAPIPLLWIVPLCIYLVSFVLIFKRKPWTPAWITEKFYLTFAWSILVFFTASMRIFPFILDLVIFCGFLFHTCMFCQYQLSKTKPVNLSNMPVFYLVIAAGGFFGGLFTAWIIPLFAVSVFEYLVGLAIIALAMAIGTKRQNFGWKNIFLVSYILVALMYWPLMFKHYNVFGVIIIFVIFKICYSRLAKNPRVVFFSILMVLLITAYVDSLWANKSYIYRHRNYYGVYNVYSEDGKYILLHGATVHGAQFKDKQRENQPFNYYHPLTPVGEFLGSPKISLKNIGLVGLGTGGLAAYAKADQNIDYYEIDPDMYFISQNLFTFTKNSKGKINFIFGDARIAISEQKKKSYDLLVIDAFSGDAIPVHLLTTEAINEYRKHLEKGGVILFHISNRYLDFVPVLFSNANYLKAYGCYKRNPQNVKKECFSSLWFALSWDEGMFNKLITEFNWNKFNPKKNKRIRPWTDKYSNELSIIKFNDFFDSIKYFEPFYW